MTAIFCPCAHSRRGFLELSTIAAVAIGGGMFVRMAHAVALTKAQRDAMTPDQIPEVMKKGNERDAVARTNVVLAMAEIRSRSQVLHLPTPVGGHQDRGWDVQPRDRLGRFLRLVRWGRRVRPLQGTGV
jgi:hypothetical protein